MQNSEQQVLDALAKRWTKVIYWVLFGSPLLAIIGGVIVKIVRDHALICDRAKGGYAEEVVMWLMAYGFFVYMYNFPFFVLAHLVRKRLAACGPDVRPVHWAAGGALIFLSLLYGAFYLIAIDVTASCSPQAGQGLGIIWFLLIPLAGIMGYIGWYVGIALKIAIFPVPERRF